MGRSILAVVAGYFTMAIGIVLATLAAVFFMLADPTSTVPTPAYLAVNLVYSGFFATLGGYVAALVARQSEYRHASAFAGFMIVLSVVTFLVSGGASGEGQPVWYPYVILAIGIGGIYLGAWVRVRQRSSAESTHVAEDS